MDVKSSPYAVDGVPRRVCLFLRLAAPGSTGDGSSRPMSVARRTRRCLRGGPLELAGQFRGRAARADQLDYLTPLLRRVRGMSFRHRNTSCPQSESVHHIGANPVRREATLRPASDWLRDRFSPSTFGDMFPIDIKGLRNPSFTPAPGRLACPTLGRMCHPRRPLRSYMAFEYTVDPRPATLAGRFAIVQHR